MHKVYRFGSFELRPAERLLLRDGSEQRLVGRAFDMLLLLVERRGEVVEHKELMKVVWAGVQVSNNNLAVQAGTLRDLLGRRSVATVKNRGYVFTLPVTETQVVVDRSATTAIAPLVDAAFLDPEVVLLARGATRGSMGWMTELRHTIVPEHGGRVVKAAEARLAAVFAQPRSAISCARELLASSASPRDLRVSLCSRDEYDGASRAAAARPKALDELQLHAAPGAIAVSTQVAGRLVEALDGQASLAGTALDVAPAFHVPSVPSAVPHDAMDRAFESDGLPMIAVLPFRAYGQGVDHVGAGDIVADQLITLLSHGSGLNITSRLSTTAFRERPYALADVAHHLRAAYVVSGRYAESSGRMTIDIEVADARRGRVLLKHEATDSTGAILHGDGLLTLDLAGAITRAVLDADLEHVPAGMAMPDLRSHALLLTAVELLYRLSPGDFDKAAQALETLRERAPRHPAPLAWLSRWHLFRVSQRWTRDPDEDGRLAEVHAMRALDLDPTSALALTMLGNARTSFRKDPAAAEAIYDQALKINPNESLAWLHKGNALAFRGEGRRALEHIEKAIDLSPLDPSKHFYQSLYAGAALTASDYERAVRAAHAALRLNSRHASAYRVLAIALSLQGRIEQARRALAVVRRLEPDLTVRSFVARSPGGGSDLVTRFGEALGAAGLPRGD